MAYRLLCAQQYSRLMLFSLFLSIITKSCRYFFFLAGDTPSRYLPRAVPRGLRHSPWHDVAHTGDDEWLLAVA
jgi:hypothetical protein